jgi:hypothetical protein
MHVTQSTEVNEVLPFNHLLYNIYSIIYREKLLNIDITTTIKKYMVSENLIVFNIRILYIFISLFLSLDDIFLSFSFFSDSRIILTDISNWLIWLR